MTGKQGQDKQTQPLEKLLRAGGWELVRGGETQRTLVRVNKGSESLATEQEHLHYLRAFEMQMYLILDICTLVPPKKN